MCACVQLGLWVCKCLWMSKCTWVDLCLGFFFTSVCVHACVCLYMYVYVCTCVSVCFGVRGSPLNCQLQNQPYFPDLTSNGHVLYARAGDVRPSILSTSSASALPLSRGPLRPPSLLSRVLDGTGQEQREIRRYTSPERQKGISLRITASPRAPVAASL